MQEISKDKELLSINDEQGSLSNMVDGIVLSEVKPLDKLPPIPSKHYFTIGEMGRLCQIKPHVLRYWEHEFLQLKNIKRRGNRRYYTHQQVLIVRQIRGLLYEQGYTISGAKARLSGKSEHDDISHSKQLIRQMRFELEEILRVLKKTS